jgi:hypothetical protein
MQQAGTSPSPEADPGRYESGELTPEERRHEDTASADDKPHASREEPAKRS